MATVSDKSLKAWSDPNYTVSDPKHDEVVSMANDLLAYRSAPPPASAPVVAPKAVLCVNPDTYNQWTPEEIGKFEAMGFAVVSTPPNSIVQVIK